MLGRDADCEILKRVGKDMREVYGRDNFVEPVRVTNETNLRARKSGTVSTMVSASMLIARRGPSTRISKSNDSVRE